MEKKELNGKKKFSILGDSISTLIGYNPPDYKVFFDEENGQKAGVLNFKDTWWGKVIDHYNGELLVNNSWSGSRVAQLPNSDSVFPSACSRERTGGLHIESVKGNRILPNVIIIYIGTNDWCFGTSLRADLKNGDCLKNFDSAYHHMLEQIHKNYPEAEIWCCSLMTSYMSTNRRFIFPYVPGKEHMEKYNNLIEANVIKLRKEGVLIKYLNLYGYHTPYDSIDGSHPNEKGMETMASLIIREVADESVDIGKKNRKRDIFCNPIKYFRRKSSSYKKN